MNKKITKAFLVIALTLLIPHPGTNGEGLDTMLTEFPDVSMGNEHYVAIQALKNQAIIQGYSDGSFKPNKEISRAEALKIISLATGKIIEEELNSVVLPEEPIFNDLKEDAWYRPYLFIAKSKEVISGYDDGSFKPDNTINLAETLKIYLECLNVTEYPDTSSLSFADVNPEGWYAKYVAYANNLETLNINVNNEIFPDKDLTRGEFAEIAYRLQSANDKGYKFGKATFYGKAAHGNNTASGEIFDMNSLTAAHKTLPFGTIVEVTSLSTGKTVEVKITDRGPYGPGRVIDLSSAAFEQLASLGTGILNVEYHPTDSI